MYCNNPFPCLYSNKGKYDKNMPQTSACKLEYVLNPIYPSKGKDIKKVNKLNIIQERNKKNPITFLIQHLK